MKRKVLLVLVLFLPGVARASVQSVLTENLVVQSEKAAYPSEAKKEIFKKAIERVSWKYIKDYLGEEKVQRETLLLRQKVIKNYEKYILTLYPSGKLRRVGRFYEMPVSVKVSLNNLKILLLKEGFLYEQEGLPSALPLIKIEDLVRSQQYVWWVTSYAPSLQHMFNDLSEKVRKVFWKHGFFVFSPSVSGMRNLVPKVFQVDDLSQSDQIWMAQYFKSSMFISGFVRVEKSKKEMGAFDLKVKLTAHQSSNGRIVGEVIRVYTTDVGPLEAVVSKKFLDVKDEISKDLVQQVMNSWKQGTFGTQLVAIDVYIPHLTPQSVESFKNSVLLKVKEVKALKERFFTSGRVRFEADSSVPVDRLAQVLQKKLGVQEGWNIRAEDGVVHVKLLD